MREKAHAGRRSKRSARKPDAPPESGVHRIAVAPATPNAYQQALGHLGPHDDDPVMSCLSALADDVRILARDAGNETWELDAGKRVQAIERIAFRVDAICKLHEELGRTRAVAS